MGKYSLHFEPFRFWVQNVLPQVYDDSLSYYELLSKVIAQLNQVMEETEAAFNGLADDTEQFETDMTNKYNELMAVWRQLQEWITNYFDNLDVQAEIDHKLDEMVQDGTFSRLITPIVLATQPPLVVDSVSEMDNISRMYILRSNSHIYQWNGTAFYDTGITYGSDLSNVLTYYSAKMTDPDTAIIQSIYTISPNAATNVPTTAAAFLLTYGSTSSSVAIQQFVELLNPSTIYMRNRAASGTWSSWKQTSGNAIMTYLGSISDANQARTQSIYAVSPNTPVNVPTRAAGFLFTYGSTTTTVGVQQFVELFNPTNIYMRYRNVSGDWGAWDKVPQQSAGRMYSIGNSILTGSIWLDGVFDHLTEYYNAPYALIGSGINIPKNNITHRMISSTGLLYDAGSGNFLTNIKKINLSNYDVLLTQLWLSDLNDSFPLGTEASTPNDGSIIGAVKELNNYRNTSNRQCQIILVSVPPVNYGSARSGENVFTGIYPNGISIQTLDETLEKICQDLYIKYISFQDWNISKYFQNYTDGDNVHANNPITYRSMGAYLGGKASTFLSY